MNFTERLTSYDGKEVYIIRGTDIADRLAFYILILNPEMKGLFQALTPDSPANLNDYGTVIASGFGHSIPAFTKSFLMNKYQINLDN